MQLAAFVSSHNYILYPLIACIAIFNSMQHLYFDYFTANNLLFFRFSQLLHPYLFIDLANNQLTLAFVFVFELFIIAWLKLGTIIWSIYTPENVPFIFFWGPYWLKVAYQTIYAFFWHS